MELHYHTILTAHRKQRLWKRMDGYKIPFLTLNKNHFASLIIHGFKIHQYKICSFMRMPSKILVGGSCQARVINNLQS